MSHLMVVCVLPLKLNCVAQDFALKYSAYEQIFKELGCFVNALLLHASGMVLSEALLCGRGHTLQ